MTPKSLFNVILKIFGLFFLREIILTLLQLVATIVALFDSPSYGETNATTETVFSVIVIAVIILAYCLLIYQLLFNTDRIIDLLKLDKGFTEEFTFNFSRAWVLTVALIVIGGVMLVNEIPNLCRNVFSLIQERRLTHGMYKPNYSYAIISAVKVIIGLIIIGERKRIIDFVEKRQKPPEVSESVD